ncbi:MAG: hypothetical protein KY450_14490 [Actinobacteria bacterium]|nr:hypothetical protein [Actinomycetota bacterium]
MRRFRTLIAVATVGIFAVAACGNDTDEAATTTTSSTTSTTEAEQADEATLAYCEASAELDEQEGPPTPEQLQGLSEVAPDEIKEDVDLVVEKLGEQGMNAFGDPEVTEAIGRVEDWEADNCPGAAAGEEEEEEAAPQTPDPDATQVAVTATDFEFAIEGDVPAEKVAFVMTNEGEVPHHMSILKFKEGTTAEQAEQAFEDGSVPQLVEEEIGQSSDAAPGEDAVVNAELEPGVYGMGCFVDEPDGVPHFFKGMRVVFEVS